VDKAGSPARSVHAGYRNCVVPQTANVFRIIWAPVVPFSRNSSNVLHQGSVTSYLGVLVAQNTALSDEVTAVNILEWRMTRAVYVMSHRVAATLRKLW
jgi:hypothetical protein